MKTWYTSDLHFGHERAATKHRGFSSVDEMNATLIENWNATVSPDDTVWILGDFAMGKIDTTLGIARQLNGYKFLVPGNHDRCSISHHSEHKTPEKRDKWRQWVGRYEEVGLGVIQAEAFPRFAIAIPRSHVGGRQLWLSHFPPYGDHTDDERYVEFRPRIPAGDWSIHGHVHELWRSRDRMINVGVDQWGYRPVSQEQVFALIAASEHP